MCQLLLVSSIQYFLNGKGLWIIYCNKIYYWNKNKWVMLIFKQQVFFGHELAIWINSAMSERVLSVKKKNIFNSYHLCNQRSYCTTVILEICVGHPLCTWRWGSFRNNSTASNCEDSKNEIYFYTSKRWNKFYAIKKLTSLHCKNLMCMCVFSKL